MSELIVSNGRKKVILLAANDDERFDAVKMLSLADGRNEETTLMIPVNHSNKGIKIQAIREKKVRFNLQLTTSEHESVVEHSKQV